MSDVLILFTRHPQPGRTKTRLVPALGIEGAARVHDEMTRHALAAIQAAVHQRPLRLEVRHDGGSARTMREWLGAEFRFRPQGDGDLGVRLHRAAAEAFAAGATSVVMIGSDCPDLDNSILHQAFEQLARYPVVLGPAADGGYYLIGLRQPWRELFDGIPWGTGTVLATSIAAARKLGIEPGLLPRLTDVDEPDDLPAWEAARRTAQKVSVIIPTLNEAGNIGATLDAAIREQPFEIIVADGGSTDRTVEIARQHGARVIAVPPHGLPSAGALSAAPAGERVVPSRRAGPGEVEQSPVQGSNARGTSAGNSSHEPAPAGAFSPGFGGEGGPDPREGPDEGEQSTVQGTGSRVDLQVATPHEPPREGPLRRPCGGEGGSNSRSSELEPDEGERSAVQEFNERTGAGKSPGRARQMNAGAAVASGNVLLFLHADTELPAGWLSALHDGLRLPGTVGGAFAFSIREPFRGRGLVESSTNLRSRLVRMPYGDQGLFVRRWAFEHLGGFPDMPVMEDYAFVRKLRALGRIVTLPQAVRTSGRRWLRRGVVRTTLINQLMILGYHAGLPLDRLAAFYHGGSGLVRRRTE